MKLIGILITIMLLASCQTSAYEGNENSPFYLVPAGSTLTLTRSLTIPAEQVAVFLQGGEVVASGGINQYYSHCKFELRRRLDKARKPCNPYDGSIHLYPDHVDVLHKSVDPIEVRMRVSMLFQKPNPFPKSIFDNVAFGPRLHGVTATAQLTEIAERSLRQAALWDEVRDRLQESALALSGGQQQRLCIARALAVEPEVILMDEPCSALDPIATAKIEELIHELKSSYTIVIVTDNMQQAARVSDATAFLYMGRLVEFRTPLDPGYI